MTPIQVELLFLGGSVSATGWQSIEGGGEPAYLCLAYIGLERQAAAVGACLSLPPRRCAVFNLNTALTLVAGSKKTPTCAVFCHFTQATLKVTLLKRPTFYCDVIFFIAKRRSTSI